MTDENQDEVIGTWQGKMVGDIAESGTGWIL